MILFTLSAWAGDCEVFSNKPPLLPAIYEIYEESYQSDYTPGNCEKNVQRFLKRILELKGAQFFENQTLQVLLFVPAKAREEGFSETYKMSIQNSRFEEMNHKGASSHVTLRIEDTILELDFKEPMPLAISDYKVDFLSYQKIDPQSVLVYRLPVLEFMQSSLSRADAESWMRTQVPIYLDEFESSSFDAF